MASCIQAKLREAQPDRRAATEDRQGRILGQDRETQNFRGRDPERDRRTEKSGREAAPGRSTARGAAPRRFTITMQKKLVVLFLLILAGFGFLAVRIVWINYHKGTEYSETVVSQRASSSVTSPYKRGQITDRKGTVLADSRLVYNVIVDARLIVSEDYYLKPTLKALKQLGISKKTARKYITTHTDSAYYIMKKKLSYQVKSDYDIWYREGKEKEAEEAAKKDMDVEDKVFANIVGITFEPQYIRSYPHGALAADLIGFAGDANVGNGGLEEYYNSILNGIEGRTYGYMDDAGEVQTQTIDATNGENLVTTIDANVQSICEKYIRQFWTQYKDGEHTGNAANNVGVIIQNINNGDILAMASAPSFSLSEPYDLDALVGMPVLDEKDEPTDEYLTQSQVDDLSEKNQSRYLSALWRNFCISSYYEPGSTAKPFTVAAGLESGKLTGKETFLCEGSLQVGGWPIRCHNTSGDGVLTVGQSVERSCNVGLMMMAAKIGKQDFSRFQNIFNFGLRTNIDLADEVKTDGFTIPSAKMTDADLATNSFGQNFDVTMIEMITGFSSLINGGNYYQPHVVREITSPTGAVVREVQPRVLKKTVSEQTSEKIREYTRLVVEGEHGTGSAARPAGYRIGGKTGTAETLPRSNGEYVVSFEGYAPFENPQIAIYVVIDRPNVEDQQNATHLATVMTHDILTEVLPYLGIYMTESVSDEEKAALQELGLDVTYTKNTDEASGGSSGSTAKKSTKTQESSESALGGSTEAAAENATTLKSWSQSVKAGEGDSESAESAQSAAAGSSAESAQSAAAGSSAESAEAQ